MRVAGHAVARLARRRRRWQRVCGDDLQRRDHGHLGRRHSVDHVPTDDIITTNICFGGEDMRTAYVTLSSSGRLVSMPWRCEGLRLAPCSRRVRSRCRTGRSCWSRWWAERLTRVHPNGTTSTVAEIAGGPNGAAVGPDGAIYVCNNGGSSTFAEFDGKVVPGRFDPARTSADGSSVSTPGPAPSPTCTPSATVARCDRRTTW